MSILLLAEFTVSLGKSKLPGHRVVQVTDRWSWLGDPTSRELQPATVLPPSCLHSFDRVLSTPALGNHSQPEAFPGSAICQIILKAAR